MGGGSSGVGGSRKGGRVRKALAILQSQRGWRSGRKSRETGAFGRECNVWEVEGLDPLLPPPHLLDKFCRDSSGKGELTSKDNTKRAREILQNTRTDVKKVPLNVNLCKRTPGFNKITRSKKRNHNTIKTNNINLFCKGLFFFSHCKNISTPSDVHVRNLLTWQAPTSGLKG